jgi:hypothetical protein
MNLTSIGVVGQKDTEVYYDASTSVMKYMTMKWGELDLVLQFTSEAFNMTLTPKDFNIVAKKDCMLVNVPGSNTTANKTGAVFIQAAAFLGAVASFLYV